MVTDRLQFPCPLHSGYPVFTHSSDDDFAIDGQKKSCGGNYYLHSEQSHPVDPNGHEATAQENPVEASPHVPPLASQLVDGQEEGGYGMEQSGPE